MSTNENQVMTSRGIDPVGLLQALAEFYHYDLVVEDSGKIRMSSQDDDSVAPMEHETVEQALGEWLSTMLDTNKAHKEDGQGPMWTDAEIEFIRQFCPDTEGTDGQDSAMAQD